IPPGTFNQALESSSDDGRQGPPLMRSVDDPADRFLLLEWSVIHDIEETIGERHAECGGALGGSREDSVVRAFHFDRAADCTGTTYSPDTVSLGRLFHVEWNPRGIRLLGFVHSHPPGVPHPSGGDLVYARRILAANPGLRRLLLPIVVSTADTAGFELLPYAAELDEDGSVRIEQLTLIIGRFPKTHRPCCSRPVSSAGGPRSLPRHVAAGARPCLLSLTFPRPNWLPSSAREPASSA
ncbi:MAG: Mov34/MPN/PAD-1 family protein, partial [Acetobacteraceae bacterium]